MTLKLASAALLLAACSFASAADWSTDVPKAVAQAKAQHKLAFLDFTGSDWCIWCKRLKAEIFDTPEFKAYAEKNLVLVELDFPSPQGKVQTPELKAANEALRKQYAVKGYPTIIVLDGSGQQVGKLGYMKGGPAAFIAELEKLKK